MRPVDPVTIALIACPTWVVLSVLGVALYAWWCTRGSGREQDALEPGEVPHEGATLTSPPPAAPPAPIEFDERPTGRHHEDTVEVVPQSYRPLIGARLIAAETQTHRLELPK